MSIKSINLKTNIGRFNFLFLCFLFSLFLIKLPPVYVLPLQSNIFTTQTLAKGMIFLIDIYFLINEKYRKKIIDDKYFYLLLFYFFIQSLSIIDAVDLGLFWKDYQTLISDVLIFTASFFFIQRSMYKKIISRFILYTGVIVIAFEVTFYIFPKEFFQFFKNIIQKEVIDPYIYNFYRNRYNLYLQTELFTPFFIFRWLKDKDKFFSKKIFFLILVTLSFFLVFVSDYRYRFVLETFAFLFTILIVVKTSIKRKLRTTVLLISFFLLMFVSSFILVSVLNGPNIISRFLLQNQSQDVGSITYRVESFQKSISFFNTSPAIGLGLGNYAYYEGLNNSYASANDTIGNIYTQMTLASPHNIVSTTLSETGILGLFSLILLLLGFINRDLHFLSKKILGIEDIYVIASWTIFIYSLFNPFSTVFINGWFWFLRGCIEGMYFKEK